MSSITRRMGQWVASFFVFITGCTTDTRIEYRHHPTESIETDYRLTRDELVPFTVDGIVVAPIFRELTPQTTQVWLKLWAKSEKSVSVRFAKLHGPLSQAGESPLLAAPKTANTDKKDSHGVQYGVLLLGELGNDALLSMAASGRVKLIVELRASATSDYRQMSFDITRHQSKHWATQ